MKKYFSTLAAIGCTALFISCSTMSYINTDVLKQNYEKKIHHTSFISKALFKTDKKKKDTYDNVKVFLNENEVNREFEVTAYGAYRPVIIPLIRSERPRLEKNLLWKGARKARKLKADAIIIDDKNSFRVIKFK